MRKVALFAMAVATAACTGQSSNTTTEATDDALSADQLRAIDALRSETGRSWKVLVAGAEKLPMHVSASRDGATSITGARPTRIDPVETTLSLLEKNKSLFKLRDPRSALRIAKSEVDELGMTHARFQQQAHGLPVTGAEMTAHYDALGRITSIDSNTVAGVDGLDVQPSLDGAASLALAKSEAAAHQIDADQAKMVASDPTLVVYTREGREPRLAWKNVIRAVYGSDPHIWVTNIDAKTGVVLERYDNLQHAEGSGVGVLGDTKKLQITAQGASFVMTDTSRGVTITTHTSNGQEVVVGQGATVIKSNSATSWDTAGVGKGAAVDAHFYAGVVFDHYKKVHARNGLDGAGGAILSTVHYGNGVANSFWDGQSMSYGDGTGGSKAESAALDIAGHEFTHGVTSATSNLEYQGQSGALNESFSDIMAVFIEHAAKPDDAKNWTLFEDVGGGLRDMKDPTKHQQPSNMNQFVNTQQDQGGVHINSGIPNNAMALMTVGGTNPGSKIEVKFGIGWEKSEKLWYRAATKYFQTRTNFAQAAQGLMQAAKDIGLTENEQNIVDCSMKAVGIATGACATLTDPSTKAPAPTEETDTDPKGGTDDATGATGDESEDDESTTATTTKPKKKKTATQQQQAAGCSVGTTASAGSSGLALGAALLAALGLVTRLKRRGGLRSANGNDRAGDLATARRERRRV